MLFGLCGAKVFEYWMIFSLKIKLNHSWKFWMNWNVPLVLERSWSTWFNIIYLDSECGRYWFKSDFYNKNSNKFQKIRFWKVEDMVTLENHWIQAWFPFIFGYSKNQYIHCKTMFTCWVSMVCKWVHTSLYYQMKFVLHE